MGCVFLDRETEALRRGFQVPNWGLHVCSACVVLLHSIPFYREAQEMAQRTNIEWTSTVMPDGTTLPGATWNPIAGCSILSPGCTHCYAMRMAARLEGMGQRKYQGTTKRVNGNVVWTGLLNTDQDALVAPLYWKKSRRIFVNSMSDLFHEAVPLDFICRVFDTMKRCPQHQFQVLTKRAERLVEVGGELEWSENVWMGVSVENQEFAYRAELLQQVPARIRFLSVEPLLSRIEQLPLEGIHWVIVGGESGAGARPMDAAWVEEIYGQCREAGVPFFFKQAGAALAREWRCTDKKGGKPLEWPAEFRVRDFPLNGHDGFSPHPSV
jgi:protein gp37